MSLTKLIEWVCAILMALWGLTAFGGCGVFNSGPRMIEKVADGVTSIGLATISRITPDVATFGSSGSVTNPEFQLSGFVGTGVHYEVTARMIGGTMAFSVDGSGHGIGEVDPATVELIRDVWSNTELSEAEKQRRILDIIAGVLNRTLAPMDDPKADEPNTDPPVKEDPNVMPTRWEPPAKLTEMPRPGRVARVAFDPNEIRRVETVKAGKVVKVGWFKGDEPIPSPE